MDLFTELEAALQIVKIPESAGQHIASQLNEAAVRTREAIAESRELIEQSERLLRTPWR